MSRASTRRTKQTCQDLSDKVESGAGSVGIVPRAPMTIYRRTNSRDGYISGRCSGKSRPSFHSF